ncbi:MAG: alpha-ribazole kinase [Tepidanaerobacter acetatoxydans]|uniref:alpha-ribazole kinase n=1 Tax=Tepidanaerobacter acetatoxydans TaxID=499229 RepID=UPI0026EE3985|nr:alpha-ribazole kinase [Tepidanaerobacter acetatoxydans]NLU09881.1 alpha-ribazole kinase [Tepidanaerobacter acetatoxydans]
MHENDLIAPNRDVSFIKLNESLYMVVACDSCGGAGEKEKDVVKVPPYIVGRFTSRVALMETLSVGAAPKALTAAICNEPDPTGEGMLSGIREELKDVSLDLPLVISTEKNMKTYQTSLGITIIGIAEKQNLRVNRTMANDKLYCVGVPKVGNEIYLDDTEIATSLLVKELLKVPDIHDIIPVGSKGIKGEAQMLAAFLGLKLDWRPNLPIDIQKTAGPSTCVLVTSPVELRISQPQPVWLLAKFIQ